jgi:hypothetical protein
MELASKDVELSEAVRAQKKLIDGMYFVESHLLLRIITNNHFCQDMKADAHKLDHYENVSEVAGHEVLEKLKSELKDKDTAVTDALKKVSLVCDTTHLPMLNTMHQ